jgi:hypothetical protein
MNINFSVCCILQEFQQSIAARVLGTKVVQEEMLVEFRPANLPVFFQKSTFEKAPDYT